VVVPQGCEDLLMLLIIKRAGGDGGKNGAAGMIGSGGAGGKGGLGGQGGAKSPHDMENMTADGLQGLNGRTGDTGQDADVNASTGGKRASVPGIGGNVRYGSNQPSHTEPIFV
jgi:hypothetical protein